jgi:hypothetical protein
MIPPSSDWSSNVYVTGYFFGDLSDDYQPSIELKKFLIQVMLQFAFRLEAC